MELQGDIEIETGVGDYSDLTNKPTINNVTVDGAKSLNDFGIASASVVNTIGSDVSQLDTRITTAEGDIASIERNVASVGNDVDVLEQRIDTAINAVTTDTELTDIRVGADGTIYQTAGAAVRGQVTDLKSAITKALRIVDTDSEITGIDIIDSNGYVVMRIDDGNIQTKNFNSEDLREEIEDVSAVIDEISDDSHETKEVVDLLLGDYEVIHSPNLYDPSLQTSETISPHYYVNGVPYSSTQFDDIWNCTAQIEIEPSTQYTIGLVPAINNITKPWNNASYGWFTYDSNGNFLSQGSGNTFTSGATAKYLRFNYQKGGPIYCNLSTLNAKCMLVKGDSLPESYLPMGDELTSDFQDRISNITNIGFEWKFSGEDLLLAYGYDSVNDAVVVLNASRANGLFDFAKLCTKPKGQPLDNFETGGLTTVWNSGTDMHAPFQFLAVNNADGYHSDSTSPGFTGGNHTLDQLGSNFKTASSKYIYYFADGKPVSSGSGRCINFEIRWANDVQAYNTVKEGGGGRSCLVEYHDMIFDGIQFNEKIKLVPTEEIKMCLWYGLQFVSFGLKYTKIAFVDGANRQTFTSADSEISSGNSATSGMIASGDNDAIELIVDLNCDMGKRTGLYDGTKGAFIAKSSGKGYFTIINKPNGIIMPTNSNWYLRGSFRFFPSIDGGE